MKKYIILCLFVLTGLVLTSMTLDLQNLMNYANQTVPSYITKDNTGNNVITDEGATLGRVLFYDKNLSSNNTIACSSCHLQEFGFGDTSHVSVGVNGVTSRHSMRLINNRFAEETSYFWDERANSLEVQTTMPIKDHVEMGFSGTNGDPSFQDLINKLDDISYYNDLFYLAFGDTVITEQRIQTALAQFIRSIQSFDSPYDVGRALVSHDSLPFPNYTNQQNFGKDLFITPAVFDKTGLRIGGGFGCASCHRPPEFDIDPASRGNGVPFTPNGPNPNNIVDTTVFKSPSIRDLVNPSGLLNGALMHTGNFNGINNILTHYNQISFFPQVPGIEASIDDRLKPSGFPQNLNMTNQERGRVAAFIRTLSGTDVYTNPKWSNPFDDNGLLTILNSPLITSTAMIDHISFEVFPNPVVNDLKIQGDIRQKVIEIYDINGKPLQLFQPTSDQMNISFYDYPKGIYIVVLKNNQGQKIATHKIVKI